MSAVAINKNRKRLVVTLYSLGVIYMVAMAATLTPRMNNHFDYQYLSITSEYRLKSMTHQDFAGVYKTCAGVLSDRIDDECIKIASIALLEKENIRAAVEDFYSLTIPTLSDSIGLWGIINPVNIVTALWEQWAELF